MTEHQKGESPFTDDLERDPGIGQSTGSFIAGEDPKATRAENAAEGDLDNDATANDGVPPRGPWPRQSMRSRTG